MATTEVRDDVTESEEREDEEQEESKGGKKESPAAAPAKATFERQGSAGIRNVYTIAKRELAGYLNGPAIYIVVCGSLIIVGVWFFLFGFWQVDRASVSRMFEGLASLPVLLNVLVIPLITMRALAEEKRSGTIELLITMPVKDSEVILGKYFAALGLVTLLLAATLLYPVAMFVWPWHMGALDWGPVWTAYLGLFLFSAAGIGIGMMFSSLTESQIIAFFMTAAVLTLLYVIGGIVEFVHGWMGDVIAFVSFQSRFASFARGIIDTRPVVYFVSVAILTLLVAFRSLESRKWS
jgi:ABC-2 type transport system permease protein